ncbi:MAG: hypothetical protein IH889_10795 [Planctomycetes bacterium]|nr:hypothetical protein [Planctomycetota bacterium]
MRRRLVTLVILLLLGAVVNVGMAWGCAIGVDVRGGEEKIGLFEHQDVSEHEEWWAFMRYSRPGAAYVFSWRMRAEWDASGHSPDEVVPNWSGFKTPTREYESMLRDGEICLADGRGWPMLALWSVWLDAGRPQQAKPPRVKHGIVTSLPWWGDYAPRILPLRPIWPGFAINTIFYAAILWLPIRGPFALRRHIRRKRGLCVACGYDLRHADHDACPECGAGGATMSIRADQNEPGPIASSQL